MNDSVITQKQKNPARLRKRIAVSLVLLLIISVLFFSLFKKNSKSDPISDKIILEAAAQSLNMDLNFFVENNYFEEVYTLNLSDMPFASLLDIKYPTMIFLSEGSTITPIFSIVDISDIQYIENFPNLESVYLKIRFPKKDIPKWMIILSKLGICDLEERFSIDLEPLAKLHHLKMINLAGSQIKDINPLERLSELEKLLISYTYVHNIKPVRKLTRLKSLDISNTPVSNFEPIKELTNLEELFLSNTKVSDLNFLRKLINLQKLELRNCKDITDEQVEDLQKALPELKIVR